MDYLDITPNPRILEVITSNPMSPINALCELIDNSIDGFANANDKGIKIESPLLAISLPGREEISKGTGHLLIQDNGPGLSKTEANDAVRAGFSGNDPFDRLGLFGVGFNISTGKIGQRTILRTARKEDKTITCITIDIPKLIHQKTYDVPVEEIPKPDPNYSGVEVEISGWWPEGTQNHGFVRKLVSIGVPKLSDQIGRRYYSILGRTTITLNRKQVERFNHCAWDEKRFVERREHGKIPARFNFNKIMGVETRCYTCGALLEPNACGCEVCLEKARINTREKHIRGWVGIQRYDDEDRYGIDFIRNGRTIRVEEKEAVFQWTPEETGQKRHEYPVDGIYGRIIGEVHLDHVPVDFMKTDFQRTSPEWLQAIEFLRGTTSLHPETQKKYGEGKNESPIYMLFQGFRRVRTAGKADMYMGFWDVTQNKPIRISRDEEKELILKFEEKVPGFGPKDDSGWWELVERADRPVLPDTKECPDCGMQVLDGTEICSTCGHLFKSKPCIKCNQQIQLSCAVCPHCHENQKPSDESPWTCVSCLRRNNPPEATHCLACNADRNLPDSFSHPFLNENSTLVPELSRDNISIPLPSGSPMQSIKLNVSFIRSGLILSKNSFRVPLAIFIVPDAIDMFIDQAHPLFINFQDRIEDAISIELANWIRTGNESYINDVYRPLWTHSNLYFLLHREIWGNRLRLDKDQVLIRIKDFFERLSDNLPYLISKDARVFYDSLDDTDQARITEQLINNHLFDEKDKVIETGEYFRYVPADLQIKAFKDFPSSFFDGKFWKEPYEALDREVADQRYLQKIKDDLANSYFRAMDDLSRFREYSKPSVSYLKRIDQTLRMLEENLTTQ